MFESRDRRPARLGDNLDDCRDLGVEIRRVDDLSELERDSWIRNLIRESAGTLLDARKPDEAEWLWPEQEREQPKGPEDLELLMRRLRKLISRFDAGVSLLAEDACQSPETSTSDGTPARPTSWHRWLRKNWPR